MAHLITKLRPILGEQNISILKNFVTATKVAGYRSLRMMRTGLHLKENNAAHKILKFADDNKQVYFGYYDITPFSQDSRLLLAIHAPMKSTAPKPETEVVIGYYDLNDEKGTFYNVDRTTTWCWQQGCRLQWYPDGSNQNILYNRLIDNQYGCVIQDIQSKKIIKSFNRPVYAISTDGRWGISLNFSRLQRLRPGYGYANLPDKSEGRLVPDDDGIWRININTGKENLLFSLADIIKMEQLKNMGNAEHYFNHLLFNPDGSRFMFFHLWIKDGRRYNRLMTCDIDGKDLYPLINEGHVSHYFWKSNNELLAFSTHSDTGMNFHLYRDKSNFREIIGKGFLTQDGHPSYSPDGSMLLTDTYPDKYRNQHLLIFSLKENNLFQIGSFYSPLSFKGEVRCDLHPRWSSCGKYICFDSAHERKRAMYVMLC